MHIYSHTISKYAPHWAPGTPGSQLAPRAIYKCHAPKQGGAHARI